MRYLQGVPAAVIAAWLGHADVAFTMKQYVQTDLEADREVANTLADLIIGGLLVTKVENQGNEDGSEST